MSRSSRQQRKPPQRFQQHPDDSELETDSEAESVSDYQATSHSEDDRCSTPDSQKDAQCGVCGRNVNSSDKSLQCDTCSEWCHIKAGSRSNPVCSCVTLNSRRRRRRRWSYESLS